MSLKKRIKDLKKQLRKDGANLPLRVQLATLYRELQQPKEAIEVFLGVALDYYKGRHLEQARNICLTVLDIAPEHKEGKELLKVVELGLRAGSASSEVDKHAVRGNWVPSLAKPDGMRAGSSAEAERRGPGSTDADRDQAGGKPELRTVAKRRAGRQPESADNDENPADRDARVQQMVDASPSLIVYTPTPLPAPLAPHDADDEDSVPGHELERYKMPIDLDPSGPIPRVSLPANLEPVQDDLLSDDGFGDPTDDRPTRLTPTPKERQRSKSRRVDSFLDEEPTQQTALVDSEDLDIDTQDTDARLSTARVDRVEHAHRGDPAVEPATLRHAAVPAPERAHRENFDPWSVSRYQGGLDHSAGHSADQSANHEPYPALDGVVQDLNAIDSDATIRIAIPKRATLLEEPLIGSNPFIDLPERPDGLPMVIHDDMELADGFTDNFSDNFGDDFDLGDDFINDSGAAQPSHGETRTPLDAFSALPAEALKELAARMTMRHYAADQYILRQEERARACFSISAGQVSVLRYDPIDPDGDYEELCRLSDGQVFGESCLLPVRCSRGSVRANSECDVYEIPRRLLRELAAVYPGVDEALATVYRERLLDSLMAAHPFLRGMKQHQQKELRARFQLQHYPSGALLLEEGAAPGGLYLVVTGAVEVCKRLSRNRSTLLATVEEGSYLSDMSTLVGSTTRATVRAAGPLELAVLPTEAFRAVIEATPELWDAICAERGRGALERNYLFIGPGIMI